MLEMLQGLWSLWIELNSNDACIKSRSEIIEFAGISQQRRFRTLRRAKVGGADMRSLYAGKPAFPANAAPSSGPSILLGQDNTTWLLKEPNSCQ